MGAMRGPAGVASAWVKKRKARRGREREDIIEVIVNSLGFVNRSGCLFSFMIRSGVFVFVSL